MRLSVLAYGLGALGLAGLVFAADPAAAAKSKMGCERGKEVWDAGAGKCMAGKPKAKKAAAKAPAKK
jgi:hypothetical protein